MKARCRAVDDRSRLVLRVGPAAREMSCDSTSSTSFGVPTNQKGKFYAEREAREAALL